MTPRALLSSLLARLDSALDRAAARHRQQGGRALGEFINTLIIDPGAAVADTSSRLHPGGRRNEHERNTS